MRYKSKVLAQVPNARPVVLRRFPDGEPKYIAIFNGEDGRVAMDIHSWVDELDNGWGGESQRHNAAWRSAYYWLVRQKKAAA